MIRVRARPILLGAALLGVLGSGACAAPPEADDDAATSAPAALGSDAYRIYAELARAQGVEPQPGTVTVIGLRGLSVTGETHPTRFAKVFDDTLVVLRADGTVDRFAAATHPHFATDEHGPPDVDGDGARDVGIIRPGVYDVLPRADRPIAGQPTWWVTRGGKDGLPGWRDTSHDGVIDDAERAASEARGDKLTAVLFHQGEGDAPAAIGCQVLPASAMKAFVASVGARTKFRYVLVDMTARDDAGSLPR